MTSYTPNMKLPPRFERTTDESPEYSVDRNEPADRSKTLATDALRSHIQQSISESRE